MSCAESSRGDSNRNGNFMETYGEELLVRMDGRDDDEEEEKLH